MNMPSHPITAAREQKATDGLFGAVGLGVFLVETPAPDQPPAPDNPTTAAEVLPPTTPPAEHPGDPLDPNGRWQNGYTLEGERCDPMPYTASIDFCDDARPWGEAGAYLQVLAGLHPFAVGAGVKCSTFGSDTDPAVWEQKAAAALDMALWPSIARELWTGAQAQAKGWPNPYLADANADVLNGGALVDVGDAVGLLEDAFGTCSYGKTQLIHCTRGFVSRLSHAQTIYTSPGSDRIYTANGSLIIADRGYDGSGPAGHPPKTDGSTWVYSTSILTARLGGVFFPERRQLGNQVQFATNDRIVHAERPAAIAWLCCQLAVHVDLGSARLGS